MIWRPGERGRVAGIAGAYGAPYETALSRRAD